MPIVFSFPLFAAAAAAERSTILLVSVIAIAGAELDRLFGELRRWHLLVGFRALRLLRRSQLLYQGLWRA